MNLNRRISRIPLSHSLSLIPTLGVFPQSFPWYIAHLLEEFLANPLGVFLPSAQVSSSSDTSRKPRPLGLAIATEMTTLEKSDRRGKDRVNHASKTKSILLIILYIGH